jgi:16S rRNA (guanine527-N7)-methyltransferase
MTIEPLQPTTAFDEALDTIGLSLTAEERHALGRYLALLLETNRQFNLTAVRDPDEAWLRHVLDSLSVLPHLGEARRVADVGSGGGLPGLPLAIVCPSLRFTLIEATGKKARFLEQAVEMLGLDNVEVFADRAEAAGQRPRYRQRHDVAVARAVGPMRIMLEYTLPLVRTEGRVLAMKGPRVEQELDEAGDAMMTLGGGAVELYEALPALDNDLVIVEVHKAGPTPRAYPRRPGEPKAKPL